METMDLRSAKFWIVNRLADNNEKLIGEINLFHQRPWSTVLRVPASGGICFFKAGNKIFAHEAVLTGYLAKKQSDVSPQLLGMEENRNWILMRDCGTSLRTFIRSEQTISRWWPILPKYVRLQKQTSNDVQRLLSLNVPDRTLRRLPVLFEQLIAQTELFHIDADGGLTASDFVRLQTIKEKFAQVCSELESLPIKVGLYHDDFHDGNLFLKDGKVSFIDWGESAIGHPFFSLTVMLRGTENSLQVGPEAPEIAELRGWYLKEWRNFTGEKELARAASLAEWIGLINRALTWQQTLSLLPPEVCSEYTTAVPDYIKEFLEMERQIE